MPGREEERITKPIYRWGHNSAGALSRQGAPLTDIEPAAEYVCFCSARQADTLCQGGETGGIRTVSSATVVKEYRGAPRSPARSRPSARGTATARPLSQPAKTAAISGTAASAERSQSNACNAPRPLLAGCGARASPPKIQGGCHCLVEAESPSEAGMGWFVSLDDSIDVALA